MDCARVALCSLLSPLATCDPCTEVPQLTTPAQAEDLKQQLAEATTERDEARAKLDNLVDQQANDHEALAADLAAAKLNVAELAEKRDKMNHKLVTLLRESS